MIINLAKNINSIETSNKFLRSVFYLFHKNLSFIWNYSPSKIDNSEIWKLGYADVNKSVTPITIQIRYKQKGIINEIQFISSTEIIRETKQIIKECVNQAFNLKENIFDIHAKLNERIQSVSGLNFCILNIEKTSFLCLKVLGFDKIDAKREFSIKAKQITDIISLAINKHIKFKIIEFDSVNIEDNNKHDNISEIKFLNGNTFNNEYNLLHNSVIKFINSISEQKIDIETKYFLSACRLYNTACKIRNFNENNEFNEIKGVTFISALEIIATSLKETSLKCYFCDEIKYKISKKTKDFVKIYGWQNNGLEIIDSYYSLRSKYIHKGHHFSYLEFKSELEVPFYDKDCNEFVWFDNKWSEGIADICGYALRNFLLHLTSGKVVKYE